VNGGAVIDVAALVEPSLFTTVDGELSLLGSACSACGTVTFPAQASCPRCTGADVAPRPLPRDGTLWAFTVQRFAPKAPYVASGAAFVPYAVGYVNLGNEVLVESRLVTDDIAALRIGQPARLVVESIAADDGEAIRTYAFAPVSDNTIGRG
jgi:uncharacterized OB-fold protein